LMQTAERQEQGSALAFAGNKFALVEAA